MRDAHGRRSQKEGEDEGKKKGVPHTVRGLGYHEHKRPRRKAGARVWIAGTWSMPDNP
ncbi:MAG: hypothetical protein AMXMBFR16_09070 [Candidatus Uhrbacteria bacterium]